MSKFNKLYEKVISECNKSLFEKRLTEGHMFAPETPFKITDDMLIDGGFAFNDLGNWAGKVIEILSDDEMIYEICGKYFENLKTIPGVGESVCSNFLKIRCKPFKIKYKLTPGNSYFICDKVDPKCQWLKVSFKNNELGNDISTEEGECCVAGNSAAGITTNSVFGSGNSAGESLIRGEKDPNSTGITTHDLKAMYTLSLNPKTKKPKKDYPVFKRMKI